MAPKSLSNASQKRMMEALEKVASLMSDGTHPNDALVKIATDMRIPLGHVKLMVNAVNTGSTNAHRLSHEDPTEKAADFPLADMSVVTRTLFPDKVPTKQATYVSSVVSNEYNRAPTFVREKAAAAVARRDLNWKLTDKKPIVEKEDKTVKLAFVQIHRLQNNVETTRRQLTEVRHKAAAVIDELRTYFKRAGNIPYQQVLDNSQALFGKMAAVVLGIVAPNVKQASSNVRHVPVDVNAAPYSLIREAVKLAADFKARKEAHTVAVKTANSEGEQLMRPFANGPKEGRSVLGGQSSRIKTGSVGGFLTGALGLMSAGNVGREIGRKLPGLQPGADQEKKDLQDLLDPAHDNEIRNIQSEAMLNDLMANDDVIRGYDPEEVIDAFNEVSQLAPFAANKKVIMRDLMRKRLSGGAQALDQFTTGEALKQQETLRTLSAPAEPNLNVLKEVGVLPGVTNKSVLS